MLTHVVLFKLKEPTEENVKTAVAKVQALAGQIPTLRHIEAGADVLRSDRSYDVALIARFDDVAGLDAYQVHPAHLPVAAYMRAVSQSVVAVDYKA